MIALAYSAEWLSAILAILVLLFRRQPRFVWAAIYVVFVVVVDTLSRYATMPTPEGTMSNHYYYNIAFIVEVLLFLVASYRFGNPSKQSRFIHLLIVLCWLAISIANLTLGQGFYAMNTQSFLAGYLLFVLISLFHLFAVINETNDQRRLLRPGFWFWSSALIAAAISFTYRVVEAPLQSSLAELFFYTIITAAIVRYLLFAISFGLLLLQRHEKPVIA